MLKIFSSRQIAVFDLDGVMRRNPVESLHGGLINDPQYWHNYYTSQPEEFVEHAEMLDMMKALQAAFWQIIILTAGLDTYAEHVRSFFLKHRIFVHRLPERGNDRILFNSTAHPVLVMRSADSGYTPSGKWKYDVIKGWLEQGAKIQFVVEDFKGNADILRQLVPVLLYERKKTPEQVEAEKLVADVYRAENAQAV